MLSLTRNMLDYSYPFLWANIRNFKVTTSLVIASTTSSINAAVTFASFPKVPGSLLDMVLLVFVLKPMNERTTMMLSVSR